MNGTNSVVRSDGLLVKKTLLSAEKHEQAEIMSDFLYR